MTEMNELTRSLVRVEELLNAEQCAGALNCLWISQEHARQAIKLINDQAALLTKQQLEIITLNKDVQIQKERTAYWEKRDKTHEAEIKELDEQEPVGTCKVCNPGGSGEFKELIGLDNLIDGQQVYSRPVPAKSVPDGFAIVPIEPTDEMLATAWEIELECHNHGKNPDIIYLGEIKAAEVWNTMISAYKNQGE